MLQRPVPDIYKDNLLVTTCKQVIPPLGNQRILAVFRVIFKTYSLLPPKAK